MSSTDPNHSELVSTFVTFALGRRTFGLSVQHVREVLSLQTITEIPNAPDYLSGVVNLRGRVLPVVNMRLKLGMPTVGPTVNTSIVVLETGIDGTNTLIGALVDAVQEVIELPVANIEPPPRLGFQLESDVIEGMGRRADDFVILLNCERVFAATQLSLAEALSSMTSEEKKTNAVTVGHSE